MLEQLDKSGWSYISHPLRLMLKFKVEDEKVVAVLHDVVEDGDFSLEYLRRLGFSERVIEAVQCRTGKTGESYEDFIVRLSSNELARKVKIEDIRDNLDITKLDRASDKNLAPVEKYHRALKCFLNVG